MGNTPVRSLTEEMEKTEMLRNNKGVLQELESRLQLRAETP